MKIVSTTIVGFGIGYDYKDKEISIHIIKWCLDIKFKN